MLIEQAARCADRLEVLDRLHRGDADVWLRPELGRLIAAETPAGERKAFYVDVSLRIDATITEERQQAKLLASLLADIYRQRANLPPAPPPNAGGGQQTNDLDVDSDDYDG